MIYLLEYIEIVIVHTGIKHKYVFKIVYAYILYSGYRKLVHI